MAEIAKCFKTGNTLRVTLNRYLRRQINAQPGDYIKFEQQSDTTALVTNLTHQERLKAKGKRK